jgi:hypothetical protein
MRKEGWIKTRFINRMKLPDKIVFIRKSTVLNFILPHVEDGLTIRTDSFSMMENIIYSIT